jgi:hypothetical protein
MLNTFHGKLEVAQIREYVQKSVLYAKGVK